MVEHLGQSNQQVGDYRLLRKLGGGASGDVYLAEQIHGDAQVAVKLFTRLTGYDNELEAFIGEIRTMMRLKHPNIVPLLDFGISSQQRVRYLVMEYAPLGTLRNRFTKDVQ